MGKDFLEFVIRMRDLMSAGAIKMAQNVKKSFGSVQSDIEKTIAENKKLADSFEQVERKAASSGGGIMAWGKRVAAGVGIAALVAGGAFAKSSAQAYMNYERTGKSFEVLAGNKGIGQSLTGELNALQQQTILGPDVFKNAQTMMGFGITAEKVLPYMKMLGEVSMGDKERLQSLTLAFSQVAAQTRLTGQDLLQFVNAGFNPLHEISVMTGKSMAVLKDEMSEGRISFEMVSKAFEHATGKGGLFNGMLDQMAETGAGKVAMLEGNFEALKIAVGERMKPATNVFIGALASIVGSMRKMVEIPVEKKLQDQITQIRALQAELNASNTSHTRQVELLHQLEQINPNIVKGINEQNIEYGKLASNINEVTGALQKKILMESMDNNNASTLKKYAKAQEDIANSFARTMTLVTKVNPDVAARRGISLGQMQLQTIDLLKNRIAQDPNKGFRTVLMDAGDGKKVATKTMTEDALNLSHLQGAIRQNNTANKLKNSLQPTINQINKTKDVLSGQIDAILGVKSMTAANIKGSGTGTGGSTTGGNTESGKSVAGGITGGGPRVININGVNMKAADKIEIQTTGDANQIMDKLEPTLQEMFLRILNSGATVQ